MVLIVAILTVRKEALEKFRAYERHAAAVMATHGGRIERTVVVAPEDSPAAPLFYGNPDQMVLIVAILTVRKEALEKFRAYERHAAAVMAAHGGRIERTVVVAPEDSPAAIKEIHLLEFPSAEAFAAYRKDPRLAEHAVLREQSVLHTELLVGVEGPSYAAGSPGTGER